MTTSITPELKTTFLNAASENALGNRIGNALKAYFSAEPASEKGKEALRIFSLLIMHTSFNLVAEITDHSMHAHPNEKLHLRAFRAAVVDARAAERISPQLETRLLKVVDLRLGGQGEQALQMAANTTPTRQMGDGRYGFEMS